MGNGGQANGMFLDRVGSQAHARVGQCLVARVGEHLCVLNRLDAVDLFYAPLLALGIRVGRCQVLLVDSGCRRMRGDLLQRAMDLGDFGRFVLLCLGLGLVQGLWGEMA